MWYNNFLDFNITNIKELITDFRKNNGKPKASIICGEEVQIVDTQKYLKTALDSQLKLDANTVDCQAMTTKNPLDVEAELF